jgi:hypothetical protein
MAALAPLTLAAANLATHNTYPYNDTYNGQSTYMGQGTGGAAQSTTQGCAFGCHWDNNNPELNGGTPNDFYEIAYNNGIQTRVQVEQSAVQQLITTMSEQDSITQYRVAVYTFNNTLTTVYPLSTNLLSGANAASNVQPLVVGTGSCEPDTNFGAAMTSLASIIPTPGDGTTAAGPKEFLFIITDGFEDYTTTSCGATRIQQPITPSECAAIKAAGVQILVLYVQYVPLDVAPYYNAWYVTYVQPYVDPGGVVSATNTVQTNLQACASSSSLMFYAADSTEIGTQLNAMLLAAENQGVRLVK